MKSLSIIIPNYNGEELLKEFLPNIIERAKEYAGKWEIIIVDDLSPDNSMAVLKDFQRSNPDLKVIANKVNLGFSGTCNAGMKAAKGEVLFFLNNDVTLEHGFFTHFSNYFDKPDTFAVTTTAYRMSNGEELDAAKPGKWQRGMPRVTDNVFPGQLKKAGIAPPFTSFAVQGAYFFADAEKMKILGGFDELFSPYIFEETDLSYRALKRGWKIYYEPLCVAHHAVSATISKKKKSQTKVISTKNKLIFVWKNIHSGKLLFSHFFFLSLRLIALNFTYWKALRLALKDMNAIQIKREKEKEESVVEDEMIFDNNKF